MKLFLSTLWLSSIVLAAPTIETRIGLFYEVGKKTDNYLFKQETKVTMIDDLNRTTEATIVDPAGKVLMRENSTIKDGLIIAQVMEQLQINEKYTLDIKDGKATFKTFDIKDPANPKLTEDNTIKVPENFFTGPSLEVFLKKNLEQIKAKKEQELEFGIFELQKAMSFDVKQTKKIFNDVPELIPVKMELSSLLSVFIDPLLLEIDPQTAMMRRYRGRTPVRSLKNGKLVPFDGDIYYEIKK